MRTAIILAGLLAGQAMAAERRIGAIAATSPTAKNNSTTAVPFTIPATSKISIQCDADVFVVVSGESTKLATNVEVKITAGVLFPTSTPNGAAFVSVLPSTGTANCQVFVRAGNEV